MIRTTVLIPQRDAPRALMSTLSEVSRVLQSLGDAYEILVVDDHSAPSTAATLQDALTRYGALRVLRLDRPAGLSAALTAGIAAARGENLVALAPSSGGAAELIPRFLSQLVRADLVVARPRQRGLWKAWRRIARIPRWCLLGLEVRDPECLFWAARTEAVAGLELPGGMYRYLATLVAVRGFRVSEIVVSLPRTGRGLPWDGWPNPGDLLFAWWLVRRWSSCSVEELATRRYHSKPPDRHGQDKVTDLDWQRRRSA